MFSYAVTSFSAGRLLDPLLLLLIALVGLLHLSFRGAPAARPWGRRARVAAWIVLGSAWLASLPFTGAWLVHWTETRGPDLPTALAGRDPEKAAMVVLAAGIRTYDPAVPLAERMDGASTQRVLTAARLYRRYPFGLIVVSGTPRALPHAMKALLVTLGVPAARVVTETESANTRENARFSAEILRARGAETVVLVTSATHLRRAVRELARAGIDAIPAAAEVRGMGPMGFDALLPSLSGLTSTSVALHELLGTLVQPRS